jgi:hypothetical protein
MTAFSFLQRLLELNRGTVHGHRRQVHWRPSACHRPRGQGGTPRCASGVLAWIAAPKEIDSQEDLLAAR